MRARLIAVLLWSILIGGYPSIARFCRQQTGHFSVMRLYPDPHLAIPGKTECLLDPDELQKILSQPFHYLESGGQSFAFESADGLYVLKLLKQHLFSPRSLLFQIPLPSPWQERKQRMQNNLQAKTRKAYTGYELAYARAREETGLLCIHFTEHPLFNYTVDLTDKLGIHHAIPLNQTAFVLQHKAEPLLTHLEKLSQEEIDASIQQVVALLHCLAHKHLIDEDRGLYRNVGFINGRVILFDVGQLIPTEDPSPERLEQAHWQLLSKIKQHLRPSQQTQNKASTDHLQ